MYFRDGVVVCGTTIPLNAVVRNPPVENYAQKIMIMIRDSLIVFWEKFATGVSSLLGTIQLAPQTILEESTADSPIIFLNSLQQYPGDRLFVLRSSIKFLKNVVTL